MIKYVIIGNSFAALFAVESIRKIDKDGTITIISDEKERSYSRAMMHEYLSQQIPERLIYLRSEDFYEKMRVKTMLGVKIAGIDTVNKLVIPTKPAPAFSKRGVGIHRKQMDSRFHGNDIKGIPYDRLLIATGSSPIIPPPLPKGAREGFVMTFANLSDADKIKKLAAKAKNVTVVGAGLIGLQCAEALAHMGKKVTVIELADHILPMTADKETSEILKDELSGLSIHTGDTIAKIISKGGKTNSVLLKSGKKIPSGLVIMAVGARPNVAFLKGSGIKIEKGIIADDYMQTNIKGIYAAGDCAEGAEIISGHRMVLPTIPVAAAQGLTAGYNMAGEKRKYGGGIPLNTLQLGSIQVVSYGFMKEESGSDVLRYSDPVRRIYKKIIINGGRITGAMFVRAIDRAGIFRHLIENKIDVRAFREHLLEKDFGVMHLPIKIREAMFATQQ